MGETLLYPVLLRNLDKHMHAVILTYHSSKPRVLTKSYSQNSVAVFLCHEALGPNTVFTESDTRRAIPRAEERVSRCQHFKSSSLNFPWSRRTVRLRLVKPGTAVGASILLFDLVLCETVGLRVWSGTELCFVEFPVGRPGARFFEALVIGLRLLEPVLSPVPAFTGGLPLHRSQVHVSAFSRTYAVRRGRSCRGQRRPLGCIAQAICSQRTPDFLVPPELRWLFGSGKYILRLEGFLLLSCTMVSRGGATAFVGR